MGFGFGFGSRNKSNPPKETRGSGDPIAVPNPPAPEPVAALTALSGSFRLAEDAEQGVEAGQITGRTSGSELSLVDDAGGRVQLVGTTILRGATALDHEIAASHSFTVREVLTGSPNSPRETVLTLAVSDVADDAPLAELTGTFALPENAVQGDAAGTLTGVTAGSTLSLVDDAGGRLQLNGSTVEAGPAALDFETGTSQTFTVRETLAGAPNSPRDSVLTLAVADVADGPVLAPLVGTFTLAEDATEGARAGQIGGRTAGSTLSLLDDAGGRVKLVGTAIERGPTALDYEAASSHSFTVREVLAGSPNSPRDTVFTLQVSNVADSFLLKALSGTFALPEDATAGLPAGQIVGRTTGSTLSLVDDAGGRLQLVDSEVQRGATALDYEAAQSHSFTVRETLPEAPNSPLDTVLSLDVINVLEGPVLGTLTGSFQLAEDAAEGATAGAITGKTSGSSLSLVDDAGGRVSLAGSNIVRGAVALDFEAATSHSFIVRETLADSPNSPRDSQITLDVLNANEQPMLAPLAGSFTLPEDAVQGASAGTITGATAGSSLSLVDNAGGRVQLVGNVIQRGPVALDYETSTTHFFTVREVLADSANSPRDTVFSLLVTDVAEGGPAPQFNLVTLDATAHEGGDRVLKFEVSASSAPSIDTTVRWRTKGDGSGSSAKPEDLVGGEGGIWPTGSVVFPAGRSANRPFTVTIVDDAIYEGNERVVVELFSVAPAGTIGTAQKVCSIVDNDPAPAAPVAPAITAPTTSAPVTTTSLSALGGSFTLAEDATEGAAAGQITGQTPGSTLSLLDNAGERVQLVGNIIQRGPLELDYETAASHTFTVREVLADAPNSPRDSVLTLTVTDVADGPVLSPLGGSFSLAEDAAPAIAAGQIAGKTAGSTLSLVDDAGGRVALSGANIVRGATALDFEAAGSHPFTLRETLAGSPNSPRDTTLTLKVSNVADAATLSALAGTFTLAENAAQGAVAGALTGQTSGSTLSLADDAGGRVQLAGSTVQRGATPLDYESATSHTFTVRETLADSPNSPRDTLLTLSVTDVVEVGAVATIAPSALWANSGRTAGSGWSTGTRPVPSMASKADLRALSAPARAPLHMFFGDRVAFTSTRRVYAFAGQLDVDGTLINTMGMSNITFHYEGTSVAVGAPDVHTYTDVNGTPRTIFGWAIDLVHNGNGATELFIEGNPRNGTANKRIIGPFTFYPSAAATQGTIKVAATRAEQPGVQYKTIDAAAAYAQQQGWQTCTIDVIESGTYSLNTSTGTLYNNAGRLIIKGSVPFTIGNTPSATNYTGIIGGTYTNTYLPSISFTKPRYKRIEFQGANCTLDFRYMSELGADNWVLDVFWNGCKITDSSGRGGRWAMGPRSYAKLASKTSRLYAQDCPLIDNVNDPFKESESVVNCTLRNGTGDIFTGTSFIYGNDVDVWGKDLHTYQPALSVYYDGGAGAATMDWVGSKTTGAFRDIVLKVGGAEVGRYSIKGGENNFEANYNVGNYTIAHIASFINGVAGWTAKVLDNSTRAQYFSRLAVGPNGLPIGAAPTNGAGKPFTDEPIGKTAGAATTFYTFMDMHADWMAMQGMNENQISWNNRSTNLRGCITYWLGNSTGARDYLFGNNIFHQPETFVAGTSLPFYVNPPLQQILVPVDSLVFVHNTYTDQNHTVKTGTGTGTYSNNALPSLQWSVANGIVVNSNHTMSSGTGVSAATNHISGGGKANLWVAADRGDFTPAGLLASSLKPRRVRYDINGNERAVLDAAGAVRKP